MKKQIYLWLIAFVALLSATQQATAGNIITKTEVYDFSEYQDEPCWQPSGGDANWYSSEYALELTVYSGGTVSLLSEVTFPETVKKVIVDMGAKAFATTSDPPELSIDNQSKSISFVNLYIESYPPSWNGEYPDVTYDDYTFSNVSTDSDGKLRIDFTNSSNTAYFYIRSITVEYETEPDPEPYAVLSEENTKLTFYYNNEKPDGALSVGPFNNLEFQSWYSSRENITSVVFDASFANCTSITSTAYWFYDCTNLTDITGIEYLKTDNVTEMNYMFTLCSRLTNLDVSNFNTANVTNMSAMFSGCSELTSLDVSKFNTAKVTNMSDMFNGCSRLTGIDVTNFNTTNVTYLNGMFSGCSKLTTLDISSFNTAIVTEMIDMFNGCSSLTTIYAADNWTTENVTLGADMFKACTSLVGGVGDTKTVFSPAHTDYSYAIINSETTSGYFTNLRYGPPGAYALLSSDNTVLTFYYDGRKKYLNGMSIGPFNSSSERPWNSKISNITSVVFDSSFANCTSITSTAYWFSTFMNVTDFTGLDYLNTANVTSMNSMFDDCIKVESLDVSNFDTHNVTNMANMFSSCMKLKSLDVSKFDTRNVTNMYQMFLGCSNLTTLDVSHFDTRNVTSMYAMFRGCTSLTSLDVNNFDVSKVTSFWSMFHSCTNLTSIFCDNSWIKDYVDSNGMFSMCISLTNYAPSRDSNHNPIEYARPIAYGGYFTSTSEKEDPNVISEPYAVLSEDNTVLTFYYDDQKQIRHGMSVGPFSKGEDIGWFSLDSKITTVVFDGSFAKCTSLTSTAYWFYMCQKLTSITGIENLKTNKVTDMSWMFSNCNVLNNVDVSGFNTYNVTNMSNMFLGCYALANINVSNFITSNVTDMSCMFEWCRSLTNLDVSSFNTAKVTTMSHMFDHCESLTVLDLCSFNTSKLSDVSHMFSDSKNLTTIYVESNWIHDGGSFNDTSMFEGAVSLVGGAGTVYDMYRIDYNYAHIDEGEDNPGYFSNYAEPYAVLTDNEDGTTKTLTFYYDYQKAEHTNALSIGPFDYVASWDSNKDKITAVVFDESFDNYKKLTSTYYWFSYCKNLATITGIEYLHTDNVTNMGQMFNQCESLTSLDVSHFNTEKVTNMNLMFCSCSKLTVLDVSGFNTANVNYMGSMFSGCSSVATLDVSHFNTERVIRMGGMFLGCSSLTSLDVSNFNTGQVIDMESAFRGLKNLTTLDVSNLNTSNVTNMYFMFADNSNLTSLDLSNFNTAKVTRMGYMFSNCSKLETIFVGESWTTNNIGDDSLDKQSVFSGCNALIGGADTHFDSNHTDVSYAHIDGGTTNPGYFTDKNSEQTLNDGDLFTAETIEGVTLTYKVISAADKTCQVGGGDYDIKACDINTTGTVTVPEVAKGFQVITVGGYAFYDCSQLTQINLPETIKTITYCAFSHCSGLTSFTIPNSVTRFSGNHQWNGCTGLTSIHIPANVRSMGNHTFANCPNILEVTVDENNPVFESPAGSHAIINKSEKSIVQGFKNTVIPEGITYIESAAFVGNEYNDIVLPKSFEGFYWDAFQHNAVRSITVAEGNTLFDSRNNCNALMETATDKLVKGCANTVIPSETKVIGEFAFAYSDFDRNDYPSLKTVLLPEGLTKIENWAFGNCKDLEEVTIPSTVTEIMYNAFIGSVNMKTLVSYIQEPFALGNAVFDNTQYRNIILYVPQGTKSLYEAAEGWNQFKNIREIESSNAEPYAVLSDDNKVLTFYYDEQKAARGGVDINNTYLDGGSNSPYATITTAVFDASFADYRPTSTAFWFMKCSSLEYIIGLDNLYTDNVISMHDMFSHCTSLTSLDLSNFNTSKVIYDANNYRWGIQEMFSGCSSLTTIYVGEGWNVDNLTESTGVFTGCIALVGGAGTPYDENQTDYTYARIDDPDNDKPGYFASIGIPGDVNSDGVVNIADAQAMVSYILGTYEANFGVKQADMNGDGAIDIFDVTLVVNIVLEDDTNNPSGSRAMTRGDISQAEIIRVKAEGNGISLAINEAERYTAFQFDLKLPEGVKLTSVKLASDIPDYLLRFAEHQGNRYRVIGLSLSNEVLSTADGQLIKLLVSDSVDETDVSIDNVLFVTPGNKVTTHIGAIEYNYQADGETIYNLNGQKLNVNRQQLRKGVYIINHKKVIIK